MGKPQTVNVVSRTTLHHVHCRGMSDRPTGRQWGGIAMIAVGVLLAPFTAFVPDPASSISFGTGTILLLALGASFLPRTAGDEPLWLRALWIVALATMAGLLGYGIGLGDR